MRRQDVVLGLLSLVAGGIDVLSYLALGVFTSAMSGNTIVLGLALGEGNLAEAANSLLAFVGYILGVAAATPLGSSRVDEDGSRARHRVLLAEAVLLAAFAALWAVRVGIPGFPSFRRELILLAGAGMGLQAAVARKMNVPGINTVVFTSTLTAIVGALADAAFRRAPRRVQPQTWRQIGAFVLYLASAVGIGALSLHNATLAAVPPFACVLLALLLT